MKRKSLLLAIAIFLSIGIFTPSITALSVGDKMGDVLYSNVDVYINGMEITGYNIDGMMYIAVGDLSPYGFNVEWDIESSSFSVTSGVPTGEVKSVSADINVPGTAAFPYFNTNVITYLNGKKTSCFNVQECTVISADALASEFGSIYWDEAKGELRIETDADIYANSPKAVLPENVSTVSIVKSDVAKAEDITKDEVETMVKAALEQTNFYDIIKNGQTVVLKPNLVQMAMYETYELLPQHVNGITTDWRVTAAVASQVRALNPDGKIYVMECSSGGVTRKVMEHYNYTKEYMPEVDAFLALESDCGDWRDYSSPLIEKVSLPNGRLHKEYYFNKILYNADVLISIPVLKTSSGGVVVTASIKNVSLGAPPGNIYNVSPTNNTKFDMVSHKITDGDLDNWIYDYYMCKPITFAVVDGLQGYQNGPSASNDGSYSNSIMNMRIIMASSDPVAIDSTCSYVMGWDPAGIGYLNHFKDSGVGATDVSHIFVCGEKVDELRKPFDINYPELGGMPLKKFTPPDFDVEVIKSSDIVYVTVSSDEGVKVEVYTDKMVLYGIPDNKSYSFSVGANVEKLKVIVYDAYFNKNEKEIDLINTGDSLDK